MVITIIGLVCIHGLVYAMHVYEVKLVQPAGENLS